MGQSSPEESIRVKSWWMAPPTTAGGPGSEPSLGTLRLRRCHACPQSIELCELRDLPGLCGSRVRPCGTNCWAWPCRPGHLLSKPSLRTLNECLAFLNLGCQRAVLCRATGFLQCGLQTTNFGILLQERPLHSPIVRETVPPALRLDSPAQRCSLHLRFHRELSLTEVTGAAEQDNSPPWLTTSPLNRRWTWSTHTLKEWEMPTIPCEPWERSVRHNKSLPRHTR